FEIMQFDKHKKSSITSHCSAITEPFSNITRPLSHITRSIQLITYPLRIITDYYNSLRILHGDYLPLHFPPSQPLHEVGTPLDNVLVIVRATKILAQKS